MSLHIAEREWSQLVLKEVDRSYVLLGNQKYHHIKCLSSAQIRTIFNLNNFFNLTYLPRAPAKKDWQITGSSWY